MTTLAAEEREALRDGFARLLAARASEAELRRVMASESGHDADLWKAIAGMGVTALLIDPAYGGAGAGVVEVETVMEEAGAVLLAGPLLSSGVMAAALLSQSSDADAKARLLPGIADGTRIAAVAVTGERGLWTPEDVAVQASPCGNGWVLTGSASYVLCANLADVLLVVANTSEGIGVFEVEPQGMGVSRQDLAGWDRTLRLSRLDFAEAPGVRLGGLDGAAVERMLDVARVALAGEQAGACRRIFNMTVEYLRTRVQFGRPIGGFQALKHMAADLLIEVESATSAAREAARALAADAPGQEAAVSLASFACADAFSQVAAAAIQMHGGIAFTWEHPAHLYLRRARADAQLFGSPDASRERFLTALEQAA